jgi:hypothetical protein
MEVNEQTILSTTPYRLLEYQPLSIAFHTSNSADPPTVLSLNSTKTVDFLLYGSRYSLNEAESESEKANGWEADTTFSKY